MWWHVDHPGSTYDDGVVDPVAPTSGTTWLPAVGAGDELVVGWEANGGGGSPGASNNVQFAIVPPASCTQPLVWLPTSSLKAPEVEDLYDCITGYFLDPTDPTLCL